MAGYGFYDTEEGSGLITGAGAIPKKKFIVERVQGPSGRKYPKKIGYSVEYAAKYFYNKKIAANNPWLKFVNNDEEIKNLRKQMGERMRELAKKYTDNLQKSNPEKYARLQAAKEKRSLSIQKHGTLNDRLERVMAKYLSDHPTPESGLAYALQNKLLPNRSAARIFLKTFYNLSDADVDKILRPEGKKRIKSATLVKQLAKVPVPPKQVFVEGAPQTLTET